MKINNNIYTDANIFKNEFNLFFGKDWIWSGKTLNELEENNYIVCNLAYNIEVILIKTKNSLFCCNYTIKKLYLITSKNREIYFP